MRWTLRLLFLLKKIDEAYANPNASTKQPIERVFSLIGS